MMAYDFFQSLLHGCKILKMKTQIVFWLFNLCVIQVQVEGSEEMTEISVCSGESFELENPMDLSNLAWNTLQWTIVHYDDYGDVDSSERIGSQSKNQNFSMENAHFHQSGKGGHGLKVYESFPNDTNVYKFMVLLSGEGQEKFYFNVTVIDTPSFADDGLQVHVEVLPDNSVQLHCGYILNPGDLRVTSQWTFDTGKVVTAGPLTSNVTTLRLENDSGITSGRCSIIPDTEASKCIPEDLLAKWTVDFELPMDDSLKEVNFEVKYHIQPNVLEDGRDLEATCSGNLAERDILLFTLFSNSTNDLYEMPIHIFAGGGTFFLEEEHKGIQMSFINAMEKNSKSQGVTASSSITIKVTPLLNGYKISCIGKLASGNQILRESAEFEVLEKMSVQLLGDDTDKFYGLTSPAFTLLFILVVLSILLRRKKAKKAATHAEEGILGKDYDLNVLASPSTLDRSKSLWTVSAAEIKRGSISAREFKRGSISAREFKRGSISASATNPRRFLSHAQSVAQESSV